MSLLIRLFQAMSGLCKDSNIFNIIVSLFLIDFKELNFNEDLITLFWDL
ncbi:hypothetical protein CHRY9390_00418 [Chryseobacterium aquaeductus]|uniref:Uncharacterized protein n=1 Tax=Chryseobacterium aquaeductus TaxID=2675056 RepID=A0A9N8ME14_9FLAO|nr:hypothetical protein CHRY9390_00418 [Chryseobacterium potabilaquae]CAD7798996.1 hypothetical protein CHRY9390_00418 [Chryseobacterium aquaeductus]